MQRTCVIFNPAAGRSRARTRLQAFRDRWCDVADFWPTEAAGHAQELATTAAQQGYQTIAVAGGDGTVHEAANGLLVAGADNVTFAVVPVGSANDYAFSIAQQFGTSQLDDNSAHPVDVGFICSGSRQQYFVESLGIGLTGQITAESRLIPNRQGLWLYGTAAFRVLWRRQAPLDLALHWDETPAIQTPTRLLSVLLGQREGNFLMAKSALLDDGLFDVVHGGDVSHWLALALLPRFLWSGPPEDHPQITHHTCRRLQVESPTPLAVHTDGELFATEADDVQQLQVDLLPSRLRVKVCAL